MPDISGYIRERVNSILEVRDTSSCYVTPGGESVALKWPLLQSSGLMLGFMLHPLTINALDPQ